MERNQTPKILRLAPDSEFVSFPRPHFILQLPFVSLLSHFFHNALEGRFAHCSHTLDVLPVLIIPGGFFNKSLLIRASCPAHVSNFQMYLFIHHYMHRYDLSFGQAGLPGSCGYPYVPGCSARR